LQQGELSMVCVGLQCSDMTSRGKFWGGHWGARQNFGGAVAPWHPPSSAPVHNNTLVVERNVPSLECEWSWVRLSPLVKALQVWWQWLCVILLMGPVGLILLCS